MLEKYIKIAIIFGIVSISLSSLHYFVVRPNREKSMYSECINALNEADKLPPFLPVSEKNYRIESCIKGNLSASIKNETTDRRLEEESKVLLETIEKEKKEEEKNAILEKRKMSEYETRKISIESSKLEYSEFLSTNPRKDRLTISGTIKNENNFKVENILLSLFTFSDSKSTNKIGEDYCTIENTTVFPNASKKFSVSCEFEKGGKMYSYGVQGAEKADQ